MRLYREQGLDGRKNHADWGGEHGQRRLSEEDGAQLRGVLEQEALPGTGGGRGWTSRAICARREDRFLVRYSRRGVRKLMRGLGGSYQRGRKLYINRSAEEQQRFEWETRTVVAELAASGARVPPLAGEQSKVYLEGTLARRWNPVGQQPLIADGARSKAAENLYGAVQLGTGEEVVPFVIDWQDSDATLCWLGHVLTTCPRGAVVLWIDQAPPRPVRRWKSGWRSIPACG